MNVTFKMQIIPLQPLPAQTFNIIVDEVSYDFTIRATATAANPSAPIIYDITIDGVLELAGFRLVAGQFLIPYKYLERGGNFIFLLPDGADFDYSEFGKSEILYYFNAAEVSQWRNLITAL